MSNAKIIEKVIALERVDWDLLRTVPEFAACWQNPENQKWHPEGTTDKHIDGMLDILFRDFVPIINVNSSVILYFAILFHDFMKPVTLSKDEAGIYHNYGHEMLGARYFWDFISKTEMQFPAEDLRMFATVSKLIQWHMFKSEDKWNSKRAKYCTTSFSPEGFFSLRDLIIIDRSYDITKEHIDLIYNTKIKHETEFYLPQSPQMVHMVIGASGSGKSTFAENLKDTVLVSSDNIREELLGNVANQDQNEKVFIEARKRVNTALIKGSNVVIDATNLTYKTRKSFLDVVHRFKTNCIAHVFLTPFNTCLENQFKRKRQVPVHVVKKQYEKMEIPCGSEFNMVKYYYNNIEF